MAHDAIYRGTVVDINDPEARSRYRVHVHSVHLPSLTRADLFATLQEQDRNVAAQQVVLVEQGDEARAVAADVQQAFTHLPWAEVVSAVGGKLFGDIGPYDVGDLVWVMFENGDVELPCIVGGWLSESYGMHDLSPDLVLDAGSKSRRWQRVDRAGNTVQLSEDPDEMWVRLSSGDVSLTLCQTSGSMWVRAPTGVFGVEAALVSVKAVQTLVTGRDIILQALAVEVSPGEEDAGAPTALMAMYSGWAVEVHGDAYVFLGQYIGRRDYEQALVPFPYGQESQGEGLHFETKQSPLMRIWPKYLLIGIVPEEFDRYADDGAIDTHPPEDVYVPSSHMTAHLRAAAQSILIRTPGARMHWQDAWTQTQVWTKEHTDGALTDDRIDATTFRAVRGDVWDVLPVEGEIVLWADRDLILASDRDVKVLNQFSYLCEITASTTETPIGNPLGGDSADDWSTLRYKYTVKRLWQFAEGHGPEAFDYNPDDERGAPSADDESWTGDAFNTAEIMAGYNNGHNVPVPTGQVVRVFQSAYVEPDGGAGVGKEQFWFHFDYTGPPVIPVSCTKTAGVAGGVGVDCTWEYTVVDKGGSTLLTGATPLKARHVETTYWYGGENAAHTMWGLAVFDDGAWNLLIVYGEIPKTTEC